MTRKTYVFLAVFAGMASIAAILLFLTSDDRFNSERWKARPASRPPMVDDLITRQSVVVGLPEKEVIKLLGEPHSRQLGSDATTTDVMRYHVGAERAFFSIDDLWLDVYLTEGQAVRLELAAD